MEILSTGEKIKRARVYKGITLKELCEDKISISKMSCIENGKVKPEQWIIQIVAEKLDLDINYIVQDVREQIENNLTTTLKNEKNRNFEDELETYLSYAKDYEYYDLAFDIMHKIFRYHIKQGRFDKVQDIITEYYELYQKYSSGAEDYFKDMASYFYKNKEYVESITYFNRLKETLGKKLTKELECELLFGESICYNRLGYIEQSYSKILEAMEYSKDINDSILKGKILSAIAAFSIGVNKIEQGESYKKEVNELLKDDSKALAYAKESYGENYFKVGKREIAIREIRDAIDMFPKEEEDIYGDFLNKSIWLFVENNELDLSQHYVESALNIAIGCNNIKLIERAYYIKGLILQKRGMFLQSEMYMNLSMDALLKFGSKDQKYKRYLEMANMYHKLEETREALKYFTLALNIEKQL